MNPQQMNCLAIERMGPVAVARFTREVVLNGQEAEAAGERLNALAAEPGCPRLLLDFANVQSLSSLMLGKLVGLNRTVETAGGRLALCNLRPPIREIFDVTRLSQILYIYAAEQEALDSFIPQHNRP
jgi:anti-sigma B factor antagonist